IKAINKFVVDGDVSDEKIKFLIKLDYEEDKLEYKKGYDFDHDIRNKIKVDLVCDIVSMANTFGGYIIIGLKENDDNTHSIEGVNIKCIRNLSEENIQAWFKKYIDSTISIKVKTVKIIETVSKEKKVIAIYIPPNKIPLPFRKSGQYGIPQQTDFVDKFREGDIFIRNGSRSERANYENINRIIEAIRLDEREKSFSTASKFSDLVMRLDEIISLLGGNTTIRSKIDLLEGSEEDIEERTSIILEQGNDIRLHRSIKQEFRFLYDFFEKQKTVSDKNELLENFNRIFESFLIRLVAVWVIAVEYKHIKLGRIIIESIHTFLLKTNNFDYSVINENITPLWFQTKIVNVLYCLGAVAIYKEKPEFSKLLLKQYTPTELSSRRFSWYRYVLIMLSRVNKLRDKSMCVESYIFLKNHSYIINIFLDEQKLIDFLCQFDFLQCIDVLVETDNYNSCYPSFGIYGKKRIEPIVEKIIESCNDDNWVQSVDNFMCAKYIDILDRYAVKEFSFSNASWWYDEWQSSIINDHIQRFLKATDLSKNSDYFNN
ncbi:ATP-binding protein, partial [Candidatus Latescibacterota bacterium]